jgi:serine/threonine-protein kinase RsbW
MEKKGDKAIKLTIESRLENVFLVGLAVKGICGHIRLSSEETYNMELCVVEAINNAIEHAYSSRPGHDVELTVRLDPNQIRFQVCDKGKSLTALRLQTPEIDATHGRGLYIIHTLMDEVTYHTSQGTNTLTMIKHWG